MVNSQGRQMVWGIHLNISFYLQRYLGADYTKAYRVNGSNYSPKLLNRSVSQSFLTSYLLTVGEAKWFPSLPEATASVVKHCPQAVLHLCLANGPWARYQSFQISGMTFLRLSFNFIDFTIFLKN